MSNLEKHAELELRRAGLFDKDSDYGGMIGEAVMALIRTHAAQGHSGASHWLTLEVFNKIANFYTLTPITSDPNEWMDVTDSIRGKPMWQNKRQPSTFSYDGGKTWYDLNDKKESND